MTSGSVIRFRSVFFICTIWSLVLVGIMYSMHVRSANEMRRSLEAQIADMKRVQEMQHTALAQSYSTQLAELHVVARSQIVNTKPVNIAQNLYLPQRDAQLPLAESRILDYHPTTRPSRRLGGIYTVGTTATSGCFEITGSSDISKTLSSGTACTSKCPACFFASSLSADITLTILACSTAYMSASSSYTGLREFVFINGDTADTLTITDGSNSFKLGPMNMVYASCYSSGSDKLYFTSNYGVAGSNVETCPDGCANPKMSSDPTASFSLATSLSSAQQTCIGHVCDGTAPDANVVWESGVINVQSFTDDQKTRLAQLSAAAPAGDVISYTDRGNDGAFGMGIVCPSGNDIRMCVR